MMFASALAFSTAHWETLHEQIMTAAMIEAAKNPALNIGQILDAGLSAFNRTPLMYRDSCEHLDRCKHVGQFISMFMSVNSCIMRIESLTPNHELAGA
jgi:hypothetical protein